MRILFLTQTYPRFAGDTSGPFIRELARALVRGGDEVSVLTPHAPDVEASWLDDGVRVASFRYAPEALELVGYSRSLDADETMKKGAIFAAPFYLLGARRALRAELARRPYDVVQTHWVVPNVFAAWRLPRATALAVGLHGSDVFLAEKPLVRTLVGSMLGKVGALTGCSPELVARICALGFPEERAHVIPYGVDSEQFSPRRCSAGEASWRHELGIPANAPLIVSVGRMATKKGYQVLIAELDQLMTRHDSCHVVLAGAGDLLEDFKQRSASWRHRMHFPGAVYRDRLPDLYRTADIFVLPAIHDPKGNVDGLPNVLLEAMATGLPIVSTAISGIPLAIDSGVEGLLVAEKQGQELIEALLTLLNDRDRAAAMGRAGRAKAARDLSWSAVATRYRAAYLQAQARRG